MLQQYNKQQIANSFSQAATNYDRVAILQRTVAEYLFEKLKKLQIAPKAILDLGAGTGQLTQQLALKFPKSMITAVDIAFGMLNYGQLNYSKDNIRWLCADVEKLPLKNHFYDLIFSNLMLQWSSNHKISFLEIWRTLKPNGVLIFSTLGPETLKELRYCWQKIDNHLHVHSFISSELLTQSIGEHQPSYISIEVKYCFRYYYQAIDLMKELKTLGANNMQENRYKGLTTKKKLQKVIEVYEKFRNPQRLLPATYEIYLILATKRPQ